ncbi:hypothetical protein [Streptosporangium sp. NPDC049078]|uniref:hypothetical protein n=1 Tax=Streptosporangium sp. NPDC049078 TaxID=3155767 RepID=UPI00343D016A
MRLRRSFLTAAVTLLTLVCVPALPAQAYPVQGDLPWSVLLCKFADHPDTEPRPPQFFRELFTDAGRGLGGFADYLADQSHGRTSVSGSVVKGWYTMPVTVAQAKAKDRWQRTEDCVRTAAAAGYTVPSNHRVAAMVNYAWDSGSAGGGRILLDPLAWNLGFTTHEILHGYDRDHSFSDDPTYRNADWAQFGEYDDQWDVMSAMHIHTYETQRFGTSAVGFNGPNRDEMGWLEPHRIVTLGADGVADRTVRLAPLDQPGSTGTLLVRVPFNVADPFNYYTVEFRKKTGQSKGIPGDIVLLHEVREGRSYLLRERSKTRDPVTSLNTNGVSVSIDSVGQDEAVVTVSTDITRKCLAGYVHRKATPNDLVCVTPAVYEETQADTADAPNWEENGKCLLQRTRRLATPSDTVCVSSAARRQVIADNAAASSRVNPARLVLGPNACKPGYVWRGADSFDQVCVTQEIRDQVIADNMMGAGRWTNGPDGPRSCIQGYVWREAFAGDNICVTVDRRERALHDTHTSWQRVLRPAG